MRYWFFAAAVTAASLAAAARADARVEGPWCAGYSLGTASWVEDCRMPDFETCRLEVIAGNRGFCSPNPRWQGYVAAHKRVVKRKRR
jgi:hypothetical protein